MKIITSIHSPPPLYSIGGSMHVKVSKYIELKDKLSGVDAIFV